MKTSAKNNEIKPSQISAPSPKPQKYLYAKIMAYTVCAQTKVPPPVLLDSIQYFFYYIWHKIGSTCIWSRGFPCTLFLVILVPQLKHLYLTGMLTTQTHVSNVTLNFHITFQACSPVSFICLPVLLIIHAVATSIIKHYYNYYYLYRAFVIYT